MVRFNALLELVFDRFGILPAGRFLCFAGTKQVVNGVIYDLQLAIAISPCRNKYTMADPAEAEPEGDPCEQNYRVAETQPLHVRVLQQPAQDKPLIVTFDQDIF